MINSIYTDLDTIFDTRLPIAYMINPVETSYSVEKGDYHGRVKDNIGSISSDIIKSFYRFRNKQILKFSHPTPILSLIMEQYGLLKTRLEIMEKRKEIKIYINTFPYILNTDEKNILLIKLCSLLETDNVELLYIDPKELNDEWFFENIGFIFMYDGLQWLESQTSLYTITERPLIDKILYTPAIVLGNVLDSKIDKELFVKSHQTYKMIIDINFLDARYFSIGKIKKDS